MPDSTVSAANMSGRSKFAVGDLQQVADAGVGADELADDRTDDREGHRHLEPANSDGSACGSEMRTNVDSREAFIERARSSMSGSTT